VVSLADLGAERAAAVKLSDRRFRQSGTTDDADGTDEDAAAVTLLAKFICAICRRVSASACLRQCGHSIGVISSIVMPRVLIAGCGYLGLATGRRFVSERWEVIGLARTARNDEAFRIVSADLADAATLRGLPACEAVIHCASSGRGGTEEYRRVYVEGMRNLAEAFPSAQLIFTSSTSVYAQNDGSIVTEDSPAEPARDTGRLLRAAEKIALDHGGCVARLAGLYGPARSVLLRKFLSSEAVIEDDGGRFVNQIHRDDAAAALVRLATTHAAGIFNVCDDTPLTQREVYTWLAEHFARPLPPTGPVNTERKRGVTNKRVSNAKLRAHGWTPRYASFRDAVMSEGESLRAE